jgi:hypothetical protein
VRPEGLGKFKNHLIVNRTRDLPVCSIVTSPLRYHLPRIRKYLVHVLSSEYLQIIEVYAIEGVSQFPTVALSKLVICVRLF